MKNFQTNPMDELKDFALDIIANRYLDCLFDADALASAVADAAIASADAYEAIEAHLYTLYGIIDTMDFHYDETTRAFLDAHLAEYEEAATC